MVAIERTNFDTGELSFAFCKIHWDDYFPRRKCQSKFFVLSALVWLHFKREDITFESHPKVQVYQVSCTDACLASSKASITQQSQ